MAHKVIKFKKKNLTIHKASILPDIKENAVLATDSWDFVDLWLKRNSENKAQFYWQQAQNFYNASLNLPKTSSPLTLYYCFLNATKALLITKKIPFTELHGLSGKSNIPTTLENETIYLKNTGILPSLAQYLDSPISNNPQATLSLFECFYNLPFLHRTFLLTYPSSHELFIPIHNPIIGKSMTTKEAWFSAELDSDYSDSHTIKLLPKNFEVDISYKDRKIIRCTKSPKRIRWSRSDEETDKIKTFQKYNKALRKHIFYIHGSPTAWYIKRSDITHSNKTGREGKIKHYTKFHPLVLTFSAMHRLSELSRYAPEKLSKHFDCKHNWLLNDFLKYAPIQFIDEISSELTGLEFKRPKQA
ncbi:YaaC family protein [Neisseria subflava]|uniref:YaaC family protein n=1 Tax=Neisseria subflava TaxID=28449 RepID=UPI000D322D2C|nr:YaaC family protein [Neisseria subflava]